jgi:hypothetical protein
MSRHMGTWFQMARGRAMVRNRAMRKARYWKNRRIESEGGTAMTYTDPQWCDEQVRYYVQQAREANREWRKYRRLDAEARDEETFANRYAKERY